VAVAEWMYQRGARKLAFMSRTGDDKPEAKDTVNWLRAKGAQVLVYRGDVAESNDVRAVISDIGPTLVGVFHIAVILRDGMIQSLTSEQLQTVLRTKCQGARNLHDATLHLPLDFFVCWTSVSAICGNKGQASYVAANAYLDAFMRWRREQGLVGTAMTLGAVPSRGLVADNAIIQRSLERNMLDVISEQELMFLIEESITLGQPTDKAAGLDWHQLIAGINVNQSDVWWAERSLFRNLYANRQYGNSSAIGGKAKDVVTLLASAPDRETRMHHLLQGFVEKVAAVLGTPIDSIMADHALSFYGLDSIVAVEFRKWFKDTSTVDLSLFDVLNQKSIRNLVAKVVELIQSTTTPPDIPASDSKAVVQETVKYHTKSANPAFKPAIGIAHLASEMVHSSVC